MFKQSKVYYTISFCNTYFIFIVQKHSAHDSDAKLYKGKLVMLYPVEVHTI